MKKAKLKKPTSKFYGLFQYIFDYYNKQLFSNQIKDCVIVITRKKNVMGHFSFQRWYSEKDNQTDELALNPTMFAKFPLIEICQTLVHEMCHAWQFHYGNPSRTGYHNKEWADKMIHLGLMPSHTGRPGGNKTGQKMSDYPIEKAIFLLKTEHLLNSNIFSELYFELNQQIVSMLDGSKPLFEQIKDLTLEEIGAEPKPKNQKLKYSCDCSNVWGKPNLDLYCKLCENDFLPC